MTLNDEPKTPNLESAFIAGYKECDRRQLMDEIENIKNVGSHPNIVSVLGYCTKPPDICLVVEYCHLGDLQSYLRKIRLEVRRNRTQQLLLHFLFSLYTISCTGISGFIQH